MSPNCFAEDLKDLRLMKAVESFFEIATAGGLLVSRAKKSLIDLRISTVCTLGGACLSGESMAIFKALIKSDSALYAAEVFSPETYLLTEDRPCLLKLWLNDSKMAPTGPVEDSKLLDAV